MHYFTFTGRIDNSNVQDLISFINSKIIDEKYKGSFTIYISSVGGDLDCATRAYDLLKSIPNKIICVGFAQVDSAALAVFLAGDKRVALEKTRFRLHEPTYHLQQSDSELPFFQEVVRFFEVLDKRLKEITTTETKITFIQMKKLYSEGKILSTAEAKKLGIVHQIIQKLPVPDK